jgi:hypothetical protein
VLGKGFSTTKLPNCKITQFPVYLVKQTRTGRKNLNDTYQFRLSLSESVAPPGTAWDAEGQRGNEANENKLMVLARAQARKGQSGAPFAQEDMTVRSAPNFSESASKEKSANYCADTLRVIVNGGALEFVIAVPPVGAPVVALIVTT